MVPIYLGEISPPAFRASFGGLAYQLGNMASSAAAQIEATAGESLKLKGTTIPDYVSFPLPSDSKLMTGNDPSNLDWSSHRLDAPYDPPWPRI